MAEEIVPVVIAAIAVLAVPSLATWYYWPKIKRKLKGKTLLLLGMRGVGKTTMAYILEKDQLPQERTEESKVDNKFKDLKLKFEDLDLKIAWDVPGSEDNKFQLWQDALADSDFVFYLVNAELCIKKDATHLNRIKSDIDSISEWLKGRKIKVIIVATHADKVKTNGRSVQDEVGNLEDYKMAVKLLSPDIRKGPVVGSLGDLGSGKDLIFRALKEAAR